MNPGEPGLPFSLPDGINQYGLVKAWEDPNWYQEAQNPDDQGEKDEYDLALPAGWSIRWNRDGSKTFAKANSLGFNHIFTPDDPRPLTKQLSVGWEIYDTQSHGSIFLFRSNQLINDEVLCFLKKLLPNANGNELFKALRPGWGLAVPPGGEPYFLSPATRVQTSLQPAVLAAKFPGAFEEAAKYEPLPLDWETDTSEDGNLAFVHLPTLLKYHKHPNSLSKTACEALEIVSFYGKLPDPWSVRLDETGILSYCSGSVAPSTQHPLQTMETEILSLLDASTLLNPHKTSPVAHMNDNSTAHILFGGQHRVPRKEGILIIEDVSMSQAVALCTMRLVPAAFVARHVLCTKRAKKMGDWGIHGITPKTAQLMQKVLATERSFVDFHQSWRTCHWAANCHDGDRWLQFVTSCSDIWDLSRQRYDVHISLCEARYGQSAQSVVLIDSMPTTSISEMHVVQHTPTSTQGIFPVHFCGAYGGSNGLFNRILRFFLDAGVRDLRGVADTNLLKWMMIFYGWQGVVSSLSRELDDLAVVVVTDPDIHVLTRLNETRRDAQDAERVIKVCIEAIAQTSLIPDDTWKSRADLKSFAELLQVDGNGHLKLNVEFQKLHRSLEKLRQDSNEIFQLLIPAINIRDSEIQKALARDSKIQARRSTALTALAAVYLPLSLATSIFGMNIREINDATPRWWAVLAMASGLLLSSLPFIAWVFLNESSEKSDNNLVDRAVTEDQDSGSWPDEDEQKRISRFSRPRRSFWGKEKLV